MDSIVALVRLQCAKEFFEFEHFLPPADELFGADSREAVGGGGTALAQRISWAGPTQITHRN